MRPQLKRWAVWYFTAARLDPLTFGIGMLLGIQIGAALMLGFVVVAILAAEGANP